MNRIKVKKCGKCNGLGFTTAYQGQLNADGDGVEVTKSLHALCQQCRGSGIKGVKALESLPAAKLAGVVTGKTFDDLANMFNGKTNEEAKKIINYL
jgi:hypothetical protein